MKKYLEQRVEELELEVKLLRAKFKLNETKDTSKYINNYPKYDHVKDYMYNPSVNLMSEPDLETAFASPFDKVEFEKNPLHTITTNKSNHLDSDVLKSVSLDPNFIDYPPYPDILGSYELNPDDVISEHLKQNKRKTWNRFSRKK